jgi:dipeptidase E
MSGAIVAMGGGGFSEEADNPLLDRFVLTLARREHPRVCFLPTASGDSERYVANFYRAFSEHDCEPSDLALFDRKVADLRGYILEKDVIYAGGGNTLSLLGVWRAHGLDVILGDALDAGAVLCGVSAGMNCWFEASVTDSFGPKLSPLNDGLGFVTGSACPHYDSEEQRRPVYHRLVAAGFPDGYAADDGAALHFAGSDNLVEVVTSREGARGYRVERRDDGAAVENALPTRYLW